MFFKKILFFSFVFCFSFASYAQDSFLSDIPCFKDMEIFFPALMKGELHWQKQKRFFRCLHDTLEIFVDKEIFIPPENRNYFTKEDVSWIFNVYFEYDLKTSNDLTNKLFLTKRILIGGSVNKLKLRELAVLRRLVYDPQEERIDYEDIYYILHKQIPVFRKAFAGKLITPQERTKTLQKLKDAFTLLKQVHTRENIVYPLHDLHKYDEYFEEAQIFKTAESKSAGQPFWFLHNLYEGLFSPKKNIQGKDWEVALDALYNMTDLFLYYKTYFSRDMPSPEFVHRVLEGMDIFVSSLQLIKTQKNKTGFPLKNLDEMLSLVFSYQSSHTSSDFSINIKPLSIPLLTRTLTCFSLDSSSEKSCKSKWGSGASSSPVVTLSFEDNKFEIFPDEIKRSSLSKQSAVIERGKLRILKQWIADYKESLWEIYHGNIHSVAKNRQFDHWLHPFFGWEEKSSRMIFGSFDFSESNSKSYQLLHYQAFLSLLFFSYLPEIFFPSGNEGPVSISFTTWQKMIREISPALVALGGKKGYKASWRQSFFDLFHFTDSFSYSSNRDELLNARELMDLTIHLLEGIKSSYFTYNKVSRSCADNLNLSCVRQTIVEDQEILAAYPRFQKYLLLSSSQIDKYKEKIGAILEEPVQALSFTSLFILLQAMDINYALIDTNQSFLLESDEILLFAQQFEEQLADQFPHLSNVDQARAYLMYSFKTGNMPFFTGDISTPLDFVNWYLDSENQEAFQIFPIDFHFLILDFYKLYQNF